MRRISSSLGGVNGDGAVCSVSSRLTSASRVVATIVDTALGGGSRHDGCQFLRRRPPLERDRETLMVVVPLPGAEADGGRVEIIKPLASPEFFLIDPVATLDLAVLLGTPWLDVAVPDPQRLNGQREAEWKLVPVVALELADLEGKRPADLRQEGETRALV